MDPDKLTLDELLVLLKNLDDDAIQIIWRDKNLLFRFDNNMGVEEMKDAVRNLQKENYIDGPLEDENPSRKHLLWVFRKEVRKIDCYIKLKIINKCKVAIVVSFHEWGLGGENDGK